MIKEAKGLGPWQPCPNVLVRDEAGAVLGGAGSQLQGGSSHRSQASACLRRGIKYLGVAMNAEHGQWAQNCLDREAGFVGRAAEEAFRWFGGDGGSYGWPWKRGTCYPATLISANWFQTVTHARGCLAVLNRTMELDPKMMGIFWVDCSCCGP